MKEKPDRAWVARIFTVVEEAGWMVTELGRRPWIIYNAHCLRKTVVAAWAR